MAIRSAVGALLTGILVLGGSSAAVAQGGVIQTGASDSTAAQTAPTAGQIAPLAPGDSHVRIVRLSEIRGTVQMDRKTGHGLEPAIANMPIVEGARLETEVGVADVEFEDGSAVRLTPNSLIEFPQLILRGTGGMASTVKLVRGMMYVNLASTKVNSFTVQVGDGSTSLLVAPSTHVRLDAEATKAAASSDSSAAQQVAKLTIAVFAGSVAVQSPSGPSVVGKKETLTVGGLDGSQTGEPELAKNVGKNAFDTWDKDEAAYQERYARGNAFSGSQYAYGISDMNYYGSFANLGGGCGNVWQPYFAGAGWDPYANGTWAMYPGAGYSWVSAYPWGWTPYHSGQWINCGGAGWGWQPGGGFVGLNNVAGLAGTPGSGSGTLLNSRPVRPVSGGASLIVANRTPLAMSTVNAQGNFEFRNNSAGLGVPRGDLGDLKGLSHEVARHGMVSMPVEVAPGGTGQPGQGVRGPAALRPAGGGDRGNWNGGGGAQEGRSNAGAAAGGGGGNWNGGGGGGHAGGGAPPSGGGAAQTSGASNSHK